MPNTALYLDELFERGGFTSGVFGTLLIGSRAVEAVTRDPRVEAVILTGSGSQSAPSPWSPAPK